MRGFSLHCFIKTSMVGSWACHVATFLLRSKYQLLWRFFPNKVGHQQGLKLVSSPLKTHYWLGTTGKAFLFIR